MAGINLDNIGIVLAQPHISENIGAVARAMDNMGLNRLALVSPKNYDPQRVSRTATGSSIEIIHKMEVYGDLKEALGPYRYVVGTTARTGSLRPVMTGPRRLAESLISISQNNLIAVLFGPEDRGLTNEQLRNCHTVVKIPTARFPSLNLAQAVMILCYELFLASGDIVQAKTVPRLANKFELEGMYEHLRDVLMKIGFIDRQNPEHWMLNVRRFLSRLPLRAREVRVIRGVCRQIDWYTGQMEKMKNEKQ